MIFRLFGTTFGMDKAQRISTFDSGSTHAMTLTAVDLDADENACLSRRRSLVRVLYAPQEGIARVSDALFLIM